MKMQVHTRRAFTLVEILMVVVILGILAAIIVPQIGARDDLRLASAARVIIADLSYAQSMAITSQRKHFVAFDANQFAIQSRTSDLVDPTDIVHPVNPGNYVVSFTSGPLAGVSIIESTFGDTSTLAFDELGSPLSYDSASDITTTLSSPGVIRIQSGDRIMTISIEPYTGEMSVNEG
jgi:prepilin-type N-terminal cleavage/methylation domain-containing protein